MRSIRLFSVVLVFLLPTVVSSDVILVPGDQPTIQAGIDVAVNGDTVSVAGGTYTGVGNKDLDFGGKAITVSSTDGPDGCIIDCEGSFPDHPHRGFYFHSGEDRSAVVEGFTIKNGYIWWSAGTYGGGIFCDSASPTIRDCVITQNYGNEGGGIALVNSSAAILNCVISHNDHANGGGGIYCFESAEPLIAGNVIRDNGAAVALANGGGMICINSSAIVTNNFFLDNNGYFGGGIAIYGTGGGLGSPVVTNSTFTLNSCSMDGAGIYLNGSSGHGATITNSIIWNNGLDNIWVDSGPLSITYSVAYDWWGTDWPGEGNINEDPVFVTGPFGDYYLSHLATGQPVDSPCIDAGGDLSGDVCYSTLDGIVCMDQLTVRTDDALDTGQVELGFHYEPSEINTISAGVNCLPSSGTLPFVTTMSVVMRNLYTVQTRRIAVHIDVALANGSNFSNWRAGHTNLGPGSVLVQLWDQNMPLLGSVVGDNVFQISAEDVTPSPYNQPPHPPAGDTVADSCTVTGFAP